MNTNDYNIAVDACSNGTDTTFALNTMEAGTTPRFEMYYAKLDLHEIHTFLPCAMSPFTKKFRHQTSPVFLYVCKLCPTQFTSQYNVEKHLQRSHSPTRYICDTCNADFKQKYNLFRHINSVHTESVLCRFCNRNVKKYNLTGHLAAFHAKLNSSVDTCQIYSSTK